MRIGFIGAGRMGRPMVARLVAAGHEVVVLGRTPEKRAAISELGADAVGDAGEVSARAEAVLVCVFTDDQVRQVCLDDGLCALPYGSGSSRVLDIVAAGGSVASFIDTAGEFVGKDAAVARRIAAELGSDLGVLDDVIGTAIRA